MSIFGPKNTGKCSQKVARHRLTRQRLTHFSSFDHYENASIFGEGLYMTVLKSLYFGPFVELEYSNAIHNVKYGSKRYKIAYWN